MEETKKKKNLANYVFFIGYISGCAYFYREYMIHDKILKKEQSIIKRQEKIENLKQYALELVHYRKER